MAQSDLIGDYEKSAEMSGSCICRVTTWNTMKNLSPITELLNSPEMQNTLKYKSAISEELPRYSAISALIDDERMIFRPLVP